MKLVTLEETGAGVGELPLPHLLRQQLPLSEDSKGTVSWSREAISAILEGRDQRVLVIAGPCSIHNPAAAVTYASQFAALAKKVETTMLLVMRVYLEKPRSTVGWKGLINDPRMDGSCRIDEGLTTARNLLLDITSLGVPVATETLEPMSPVYLDDLYSYCAIGARTAESQIHREIASAMPAPVGFKNSTSGDITVALNGMVSASHPHAFLGLNGNGSPCIRYSPGNKHAHMILRGGVEPNYDEESILRSQGALRDAGLSEAVIVDCSHGNSRKDHTRQPGVFLDVVQQRIRRNTNIVGLMLESNLKEGKQNLTSPDTLDPFVSVTDSCIDWTTTEDLILSAHELLRK